jgi:putative hydrolase of the HAD superfamily
VLFEPYGTLIDVETDERDWYAYLNLSRFLEYRGVRLTADELRWLWFEQLALRTRQEDGAYPEADARAIWRDLLTQNSDPCRQTLNLDEGSFLSDIVTLHRALTRRTLRLMEGARTLLDELKGRVRLGVVSDAQPDYLLPELQLAGIAKYFDTCHASGAHGYRKPDARLIQAALDDLDVEAERTLFIGGDTGRDVAGATAAGMRSLLVLTPYGSKDIALGNPDFVVDETAGIAAAVRPLLPAQ